MTARELKEMLLDGNITLATDGVEEVALPVVDTPVDPLWATAKVAARVPAHHGIAPEQLPVFPLKLQERRFIITEQVEPPKSRTGQDR